MQASGLLIPEDLASMGSRYVALNYASNLARRHISLHRVEAVVKAFGLKSGHVLDLGCGPGFSSVLLGKRVPRVTAMDIDPATLAIADRLARLNSVDLETLPGDASKPLPFPDGHFDGLISVELIEHIRDWRRAIAEMCRVVKPGGRLAVSTPARYGLAQIVKTSMLKIGLKKPDTYEYFIPRTAMIREMEAHGVRVDSVKNIVLTAPMVPDRLMPLVRGVEHVFEASPGLRRLCSTSIYAGRKGPR